MFSFFSGHGMWFLLHELARQLVLVVVFGTLLFDSCGARPFALTFTGFPSSGVPVPPLYRHRHDANGTAIVFSCFQSQSFQSSVEGVESGYVAVDIIWALAAGGELVHMRAMGTPSTRGPDNFLA